MKRERLIILENEQKLMECSPTFERKRKILNSGGRASLTSFTEIGGEVDRKLKIQRNSE